jgi:hypothetical protein
LTLQPVYLFKIKNKKKSEVTGLGLKKKMLLKKINILKQKSWFPSIQEKKNGKKNLKTKNIYIYIYTQGL